MKNLINSNLPIDESKISGTADSAVLGQNTFVTAGKPYLVELRPSSAEVDGISTFSVSVIGKFLSHVRIQSLF